MKYVVLVCPPDGDALFRAVVDVPGEAERACGSAVNAALRQAARQIPYEQLELELD